MYSIRYPTVSKFFSIFDWLSRSTKIDAPMAAEATALPPFCCSFCKRSCANPVYIFVLGSRYSQKGRERENIFWYYIYNMYLFKIWLNMAFQNQTRHLDCTCIVYMIVFVFRYTRAEYTLTYWESTSSQMFFVDCLVNIHAMYCHVLFLHHFQVNFNTSGFGKTFDNFFLTFHSIHVCSSIFLSATSATRCCSFVEKGFNLGIKQQVMVNDTATVSSAISSKEPKPKDGTEARQKPR